MRLPSNADLTISEVVTHDISQARSLFQDDDDAGQDFTADLVLTGNVVGSLLADGTDSGGTNENANFVSEADGTSTIALVRYTQYYIDR